MQFELRSPDRDCQDVETGINPDRKIIRCSLENESPDRDSADVETGTDRS